MVNHEHQPGRCAHQAGSKTRVPDSDVAFHSIVMTSMIGREPTSDYPNNKKPQHCRGAVGTSTSAVACAFASQPQPLLSAHPSVLSLSALLALLGGPTSSPLSNMMVSPFLPSPLSPRSPFQWTCDKSWDKRNTTRQRVACLDSSHKKLASVEGDDGVGHKNDRLLGLRLRRDLLLHSPSLRRVAQSRSCGPLRPLSECRRDQRACHPSTSGWSMISPL